MSSACLSSQGHIVLVYRYILSRVLKPSLSGIARDEAKTKTGMAAYSATDVKAVKVRSASSSSRGSSLTTSHIVTIGKTSLTV